MPAGQKPKPSRSLNKGSSTTAGLNSDYEDDFCCNDECPGKVSFRTKKTTSQKSVESKKTADGQTQKTNQKNKAGQVPQKVNKAGQKNEGDCDYPCEKDCLSGCYDDLFCNVPWHEDLGKASNASSGQSDMSEVPSDISCHCSDDDKFTDMEDEEEPKNRSKEKLKKKPKRSRSPSRDKNKSEDGDEGDDEATSGDEDDKRNPKKSKSNPSQGFDITENYLSLSHAVIYPNPMGWRCPLSPCCRPCSAIPGKIIYPPGCFIPQNPNAKSGNKCLCGKQGPMKDNDDDSEEDEDDLSDDDDDEEKGQKGKKGGKDTKCTCNSSRGLAKGSKTSKGSKGANENAIKNNKSGSKIDSKTKVIPCTKKCDKCKSDNTSKKESKTNSSKGTSRPTSPTKSTGSSKPK